jgi:site-specific DNA-cytosine methylase
MTFPDDFAFPDKQPMTSVAKQIGNAVCPRLAERVAETLAAHILGSDLFASEAA